MKKLKAIMAVGLSLTCHGIADEKTDLNAGALYQAGLTALKQGKPDEAKIAFKKVLQLKPGHAPSRYQLARIPELNARAKIAKRKALFTGTMLKEVNFRDATLGEALEALNAMSVEASEKKFAPNFVIQDPSGKLQGKTVTLKMNNIPLAAVLTYLLDGVGAKARYDEHATVIRPTAN